VCQAPSLAGRRELAFALSKDDGLPTIELVLGHHTANGVVWTHLILAHYKPIAQLAGILQKEQRLWMPALTFHRLVSALCPGVPLRTMGTGAHLDQAIAPDEGSEVPGYEPGVLCPR